MPKVQINIDIDLLSVLPQLDTKDLELCAKEINKILTQRKTESKKAEVADLLQTLNEKCVLSEKESSRFYELRTKQAKEKLAPKELKELFKLIKEEENLRIKRIKILGKISKLRDIPLAELNKELGIKTAKYA